jgi:hypothetical protein
MMKFWIVLGCIYVPACAAMMGVMFGLYADHREPEPDEFWWDQATVIDPDDEDQAAREAEWLKSLGA